MTAQVRLTEIAASHVRTIDSWWQRKREAAPDLFSAELAEAPDLVSRSPRAGVAYRRGRVSGLRRFLLRSTRYPLYYRDEGDSIVVLAVWSSVRGSSPDLRSLR
jgi:plasmid stabilization system protein ParE